MSVQNYHRFYASLNRLPGGNTEDMKETLVSSFTDGRTTSLKEMTQKEVACKMGISQSYISRLEKRIMLRLRKELIRQTSCA